MTYLGDITLGDTIDLKFCTTAASTGAPTTLAGTPVISAYPGNSITQLTAGITLTVDFDGVTGLHNVRVVASSGNGYADATDYALVITTGTVGGTSAVGYVVGHFSIGKRSALRPTVAARTLDVSAAGNAGIDWSNIEAPTTAQNLSGTNIDVDQVVASVSGAVGSVTGAVGSVAAGGITAASIANGAIDAATFAAGAIDAAAIADGAIDALTFAAGAINAAAIATDAIDGDAVAASAVTEIQSGLATAAALDAVDNFIDTEIADIQARLPAALVGGRMASIAEVVGDKTGYALTADFRIRTNTALDNFMFLMVDSSEAPLTGLTVTATRSIDGAAFAACANAVVEVSNGIYRINLAATDLNGTVICLRFTAAGARDRFITIVTQTE